MVLCPPFPNKEQDTGPIILVIIKLQKIRYTARVIYRLDYYYAQISGYIELSIIIILFI